MKKITIENLRGKRPLERSRQTWISTMNTRMSISAEISEKESKKFVPMIQTKKKKKKNVSIT